MPTRVQQSASEHGAGQRGNDGREGGNTGRGLDQFTDSELAKMVRDSIYLDNARFGNDPADSRFLILFAVPYGNRDRVNSLSEALEGFRELLSTDDWPERSFQIYDHESGIIRRIAAEELCRECGDGIHGACQCMARYECQNCSSQWSYEELIHEIADYRERIAPGEPEPAGECPQCGALCHGTGGAQ